MESWADLRAARLWYRKEGVGEPVLLLHGGLSDGRDFNGNLDRLSDQFCTYVPDRRGHGHSPDFDGPLSVEIMVGDMAEFIESMIGEPAHVVGYSVGATIALHLAIARPDLVRHLVSISGALGRNGWHVRPQVGDPPEPLLRAYAEVSPDGADHFRDVIERAAAASEDLGSPPSALSAIDRPALIMVGDDDFVSLRHIIDIYEALPEGALAVLSSASHLLLLEHGDRIVDDVSAFLTSGPQATMLPIQRPNRGRTFS